MLQDQAQNKSECQSQKEYGLPAWKMLRVPASFDDVDEPDEGGLGELGPPQQCEGMWETTLRHCGVQRAV